MYNYFEKVRWFYILGLYKKRHVAEFVKGGCITPEQYEEITGEAYE